MSLKSLVQLFAEKFLVSKKEWVGHQSLPHHRVELDTSVRQYVAPTDGWIGCYANTVQPMDVFVLTPNGLCVARFSATQNEPLPTCGTLPISKGQTFKIFSPETVGELWFAPANGSST